MAKLSPLNLPVTTANINGKQVSFTSTTQLQTALNLIINQVNASSSGQISGAFNASDAPPTQVGNAITSNPTGNTPGITWGVGDFMRDSNPQVKTMPSGNTWVRFGWLCVQAGNVGTANPPDLQEIWFCTKPF